MNADSSIIHWPAEWSVHDATWLAWPHNVETWPRNLQAAQAEFTAFVRTIAEVEPVKLLCGGDAKSAAVETVGSVANVELIDLPTNDAWIRDWGPTFACRGNQLVAIDWTYNAWGGKYPPFDDDAVNASRIATHLGIEATRVKFIVEGGAIETNGTGVLLTTKSCLLNKNRSGPLARISLEAELKNELGVREVCWLSGGDIVGDDTDGHIDQIARFVDETTIVVASEPDSSDQNHEIWKHARKELIAFNASRDETFTIVDLPSTGRVELNSVRLPASYANFYFANEIMIVPQFDAPADAEAIRILQSLVPGRKVIGLPSTNLSAGLGSFHCLSQQQPPISR